MRMEDQRSSHAKKEWCALNYVIFFLKYIIITLFFAAFLYLRLVRPHKLHRKWCIIAVLGCLLVGGASAFALPVSLKLAKTRALYERVFASDWLPVLYYTMIFLYAIVACIVVRDCIWSLLAIVRRVCRRQNKTISQQDKPENAGESEGLTRREFLRRASTITTVGLATAATPTLAWFGKKTRVVRHIDVSMASIPPGLDGLRIVHLSDIHVGNTINARDVAEIVAETNALTPDLIAITGDIADGYPDLIGSWLDPMRNFKAPLGTWFVTGNHDHMWDGHGWCDVVSKLGIHVLDNAHKIVDVGGTPLAIAGAIDASGDRTDLSWQSDPEKALSGIAPGIFRLMLVHKPVSVDRSFAAGADLVLLGHTHGGQCFPLNLIVNATQKYAHGLYRVDGRVAFVSCGTGYWGPPLRLGIPCEIDVLTLRRV